MKTIAALLCSCLLAHAHTTLDLKVAHQSAPLGMDDSKPRLSWRMEGGGKGLSQSDYQILVASSEDQLAPGKADLWDSGQVKSTGTNVAYASSCGIFPSCQLDAPYCFP